MMIKYFNGYKSIVVFSLLLCWSTVDLINTNIGKNILSF